MNLIKQDVRYQKDRSFIFTTTIIPSDELQKLFPGDSAQLFKNNCSPWRLKRLKKT